MPRFFTTEIQENTAFITGEDAAHLTRVLRAKPGEQVVVCDMAGTDYTCEITDLSPSQVTLTILSQCPTTAEPTLQVRLFQGVPKGDKMELIVQKSVELGAVSVIPVFTERCVSRPDQKSQPKKVERWGKIAAEAAKQSQRGRIPTVEPFCSLSEALASLEEDETALLFYEQGGAPLSQLLQPIPKKLALFIGPEGGWDAQEVERAIAAGAKIATLGPRILRTETAPLCALSAVMFACGELE